MLKIPFLILAAPWFFGAAFGVPVVSHKTKPVQAMLPTASSGPFRDVPPNHWAAQAVEALRQKGIVHGYPSPARVKAR